MAPGPVKGGLWREAGGMENVGPGGVPLFISLFVYLFIRSFG